MRLSDVFLSTFPLCPVSAKGANLVHASDGFPFSRKLRTWCMLHVVSRVTQSPEEAKMASQD